MKTLPAAVPADLIPGFLRDTWAGSRLVSLYEIYHDVDRAIERWQAASGLGCPAGCGKCCRRYEPTVLPLEAMAVAAWIRKARPASVPVLEGPRTSPPGRCPFYDDDNPLHCTVYPSRPLECRLFAFAAVRSKQGSPVFRLCRDMPGPEPRVAPVTLLVERYGAAPPVMQDASTRLSALDDGPPRLLGEQATHAWNTLLYLQHRVAATVDAGYDGESEGT
jgi:Fe-S-cluster containining protein